MFEVLCLMVPDAQERPSILGMDDQIRNAGAEMLFESKVLLSGSSLSHTSELGLSVPANFGMVTKANAR